MIKLEENYQGRQSLNLGNLCPFVCHSKEFRNRQSRQTAVLLLPFYFGQSSSLVTSALNLQGQIFYIYHLPRPRVVYTQHSTANPVFSSAEGWGLTLSARSEH